MGSVQPPAALEQVPSRESYAVDHSVFRQRGTRSPEWLAWGVVGFLLLLQLGLLCGGMARSLHGSTDFRAFYATGKLVAHHHGAQIYNLDLQAKVQRQWISNNDQTLPFLYPAFAALLFVPFGYLPYKCAFLGFAALNLTIFGSLIRWASKELELRDGITLWPAYALCFGSVSAVMVLLQGQISCLLICVFVGTLELARRRRESLAGIVLALAFAKFQLALPIVFLLCAWKRWNLVRGVAIGAVLLALISVLVAGTAGTMQYIHMMSGVTRVTAVDPANARAMYGMFPSDMPNIHGLAYVLTKGSRASLLITVLMSGLLMAWAARKDRGLPAALCVAMLVSYHFQAYDVALLLVPLSVSLGDIVRQKSWTIPQAVAGINRTLDGRTALVFVACVLLVAPVGATIVYSRMSWVFCVAIAAVLMSLSPDSRRNV